MKLLSPKLVSVFKPKLPFTLKYFHLAGKLREVDLSIDAKKKLLQIEVLTLGAKELKEENTKFPSNLKILKNTWE